jgi:hypothetical protein
MYSKAITDHARATEKIFKYNADQGTNDVAYNASKLIDYPTLEGCHIFNGIALGSNKYLKVHTDKDFCYSVVTVFKKEACVVAMTELPLLTSVSQGLGLQSLFDRVMF